VVLVMRVCAMTEWTGCGVEGGESGAADKAEIKAEDGWRRLIAKVKVGAVGRQKLRIADGSFRN
jgi:hypothetical protein